MALAVLAIALMVGCSKEDTGDVKAEADKIDKGLENSPKVPDDLAKMNVEEGAPIQKGGGR